MHVLMNGLGLLPYREGSKNTSDKQSFAQGDRVSAGAGPSNR
ncbi:hypothetical protein NOR53_3470 [gamma proteobacterium NOR5-3]|nr:hypothetical protein NOR53_3470 [gamma proteobacterium NOR5-3]